MAGLNVNLEEADFLASASELINRGFSVFPCAPGEKRPLVKWREESTNDNLKALDWNMKWPNANTGLDCGKSGLYVFDLDGDEGIAEWQDLQIRHGKAPSTVEVYTGGGGQHIYFRKPAGNWPNTAKKIAPHIDTRGDGGYVLAPGSMTKGLYRWKPYSDPDHEIIAGMPEWLQNLVKPPQIDERPPATPITYIGPRNPEKWLQEALERASIGNRNDMGLWLACQLRDEGFTQAEAENLNYPEMVPQNGHRYSRKEWEMTVRSVYSRPPREPAVSNGSGNHQVVKVYDPEPPEVFDPDFFRGMEAEGIMIEQPPNNEDIIEYKDAWKRYTLADAYREREPRQYIADGLFILPSLNIVYGAPATFKSLLLLDLALCIASGHDFLPPAPWQGGAKPIETMQAPVMWLDFDNGKDELDERIEALARARNLSEGIPFYYFSMPNPWLDASNKASIGDLILRAKAYQAKFICIDNLGNISGDSDENSAQMVKVTGHLRQLAEATGAAVVVVHHQRKSNGTTGRSGETLRGHSSIEAALNLALLVEREEYADTVKMRATKSRGKDVMPFSAAFTFENKDNGDLKTAKFYGLTVEDTGSNYAIEREIMTALQLAGMNKTELTKTVKETLPDVGTNRIRGLIERLAATGKIREVSGPRTAKLYCLK